MELKENERIDDLQIDDLKIIQNKDWFCFGIDSVLLSGFASEIHRNSRILDLGTGTGILALLLSSKVENSKITGIEIQKDVTEMAIKSVKLNNLEDRIEIINKNVKELKNDSLYDAVVTNPPYKKEGTGITNKNNVKLISRHEINGNLEDFIKAASISLKDNCSMYMVNRPERLADIFEYSRKYNLEPKVLQIVYSKTNSKPNLVLVKATKYANRYLKVLEPLYIYKENGEYTDEVKKIYGK